ncbi:MAG TPA: hypothetical protein VGO11_11845 [Chthoniobacteraceae bacterium]|jgi:hypothetical protein|nr:hypothetical protein [Chthoniobacteraceae bacterium]
MRIQPPANCTRFTVPFLRFLAILQILTAGIALIPLEWIEEWHAWLGLGAMPHDPVLCYVLRGGAYVQGGIGVLIWIMATDVARYRPLIVATAVIYLIGGPAFYFIESIAGMPRFWCLFDGVSCAVVGAVLLALSLRSTDAGAPALDFAPPQT